MSDFAWFDRGRYGLARWCREVRRGREIRRALGPIGEADRAAARAVFARFRPLRAPVSMIRIGPEWDGGYVLPDDLGGIAACFSPGVSDATGFDEEIAARGIACFLADASVAAPADLPDPVTFEPFFLGAESKGDVISLDDWVRERAPEVGDLLLQMDIEGAEYEVLGAADAATLRRFRVIVLEYHDLWRVFTEAGRVAMSPGIEALARDFEVVHVHGNNFSTNQRVGGMRCPSVIEVTYLRKDRMGATREEANLPHPLDRANNRHRPEIVLPRFWEG